MLGVNQRCCVRVSGTMVILIAGVVLGYGPQGHNSDVLGLVGLWLFNWEVCCVVC